MQILCTSFGVRRLEKLEFSCLRTVEERGPGSQKKQENFLSFSFSCALCQLGGTTLAEDRSFLLCSPAHSSWLQNQPHRQGHTQCLHVSNSLPSPRQVVSKINTVTHQSGFPEMLIIVYWMTRLYNRGGSNCSRVYAPVIRMYCFAFHERQVLQPTQSLVGCNIFQKQIP